VKNGRKQSWNNISHYPGICLQELRKTTKKISHNSESLGYDLNLGSPTYKAGVLTTWLQSHNGNVRQNHSMTVINNSNENVLKFKSSRMPVTKNAFAKKLQAD
jgi:hypothetical protein